MANAVKIDPMVLESLLYLANEEVCRKEREIEDGDGDREIEMNKSAISYGLDALERSGYYATNKT